MDITKRAELVIEKSLFNKMSDDEINARLKKLREHDVIREYIALTLLQGARYTLARRIPYSDPVND